MSTTQLADQQHPWIGLAPFTESDCEFFAGRGEEIDEVLRLVRRDTLTLLYGVSGLGKTSILQAGLFPALREEDYLPVPIRLDYVDGAAELAAGFAELATLAGVVVGFIAVEAFVCDRVAGVAFAGGRCTGVLGARGSARSASTLCHHQSLRYGRRRGSSAASRGNALGVLPPGKQSLLESSQRHRHAVFGLRSIRRMLHSRPRDLRARTAGRSLHNRVGRSGGKPPAGGVARRSPASARLQF